MLKFLNPIFLVKYLYARFYVWFTFFLMNWTTKRVHKLMLKIGKNPDFVPPPPPPKVPFSYNDENINRSWIVNTKVYSPAWLAVTDSYQSYVKSPVEHPVLRSRAVWEEKQKTVVEPTELVPFAPTITESNEINASTIQDVLKDAVTDPDFKVVVHKSNNLKSE